MRNEGYIPYLPFLDLETVDYFTRTGNMEKIAVYRISYNDIDTYFGVVYFLEIELTNHSEMKWLYYNVFCLIKGGKCI